MHKLLTKTEAKDLLIKNGLTTLSAASVLNLTIPTEWQGGKAYWRECELLEALAKIEGKDIATFAPLSEDFLLQRGSCCRNGCKHCPY